MEAVVERENMWTALRRVKANKGSAGVDGMSVDDLMWSRSAGSSRPRRRLKALFQESGNSP